MVSEHLWCNVVLKQREREEKEKKGWGSHKKWLSECWLLECCDPQLTLFDPQLNLFDPQMFWQARIVCKLEHRTHDQKIKSSNPGRSGGRIFFLRVNCVCWLLLSVHSTPMLPQWCVKDPGHSAKSAGGRLHLNIHTSLTRRSWSGLTMLLSRQSVGTYQETSPHATCQGTLSHSHLSSLSYCGLILA